MKARAWVVLLGLLPLGVWAQFEDASFDKKVTFACRAARVPVLLEALSQHVGVSLKTVPALEDEVLVVDVHDLPLRDLLTKIGDESLSEWNRTEGVWYLSKSSVKVRELAKSERARKIESIKKVMAQIADEIREPISVDSVQKRIEEMRKLDEQSERFDAQRYSRRMTLARQNPVGRALSRLFLKLDPAQLVDLGPGERVVFSSHPTPMQRPLPAGATQIIANLAAEQRDYAAILGSLPPSNEADFDVSFGRPAPKKPFKSTPARVLLVVTDERYSETPTVSLRVYDEKGAPLASYEFWPSQLEWDARERQAKPPANSDPSPIQFSPDSVAYSTALAKIRDRRSGDLPDIAPEWLDRLARPDLFEPLSYGATDLLVQMAKSKGGQLVLSVRDELGQTFSQLAIAKRLPTLGEASHLLGARAVDGWFALEPIVGAPPPNRARRAAMARFFADIRAKGRVTLDNLAQLALAGEARQWGLATMTAPAFMTELALNWWDKGNIEAIRLYGTLNAQQRALLATGKGVPYQSLAPLQKSLVNRLIFGADAILNVEDGQDEAPVTREEYEEEISMFGDPGWLGEPTNALPRGIPNDAILTLTSKVGPVIFPSDSASADRGGFVWAVDPDSLAGSMAYRERPDLFPWTTEQPAYDIFRVADRQTWTLRIDPRPGVSAEYPLNDDAMQTKGRGVAFKDLPNALREQVEKAMAKIRESFKNMKPGDFGGSDGSKRPPPPF